MQRNVTSFKVAIREGHEPRLYTYDPDQIPLGEYDAVLDFKTWSRRIIAINCYFTRVDTKEKLVVTVYCDPATGQYRVPGSPVDFAICKTGVPYRIRVAKTIRGKVKMCHAVTVLE